MAITRLGGKSFLTLRGPETAATVVDCPAEGQWVSIRFKPGTFMPRFLPGNLRDHKDVTLPHATGHSFWLNGSAVGARVRTALRWKPDLRGLQDVARAENAQAAPLPRWA